jgi:AcrR family transcriptional regulator
VSRTANLTETFARRAIERATAERREEYEAEIQRIVDATYALIGRTGDVDPSLRDILKETGLSTQAFYRYLTSKDELLLLLLDDGRRRLLGYLQHRVDAVQDPDARLRAWVEGVLAQCASPAAAARTRPFVANQVRLADRFPEEQQASVDLLVEQVARVLDGLRPPVRRNRQRDAEAAYRLVFATLELHLARRTHPSAAETDHLVAFISAGARSKEKP